jgi:phosphofructokinase-like protein
MPRAKRGTVQKRKRPVQRAQAGARAIPSSQPGGIHRACILTGGGDAPGLNAVVRAFVKSCADIGIEVLGSEDGFEGLIQPGRLVHLGRSNVRGILPRGGSILGCSTRANPFAYPVTDVRGRERLEDMSETVIERLKQHEIDALILVGGDGTMHHAREFMHRGVRVIGVPKTIDNDLFATDYTFGFDTALNTATWAIDTLHTTAESHDRVMIVEVMGRYAGWIALCAGIAGGADVIVIPEIPYDVDRLITKIKRRSEQGATFSIIVVGEGACERGRPRATVERARKGHLARLGGAGHILADRLEGKIPHEIRVTVLGHLQRGGSPSAFDRLLGTRFGVEAAMCCKRGEVGVMVALRGENVVTVSVAQALHKPKLVPPRGELIRVARRVGVELGA